MWMVLVVLVLSNSGERHRDATNEIWAPDARRRKKMLKLYWMLDAMVNKAS